MSFSNMMQSGFGPGAVGILLAMLVLGGFGVLFIFAVEGEDNPALATAAITALRAKAESQGCTDFTPLWAGQNTSGCQNLPAAELTRNLAHKLGR